jgi:probable HAF family extracellular repeat protein
MFRRRLRKSVVFGFLATGTLGLTAGVANNASATGFGGGFGFSCWTIIDFSFHKPMDLELPAGAILPEVLDLNDLGDAVGHDGSAGGGVAFMWREDAMNQTLPTLPGGSTSKAWALNDNRVVVGESATGSYPAEAFKWDDTNGTVALTPLAAGPSYAHDINDSGVVAGSADDGAGNLHAVYWDAGGTLHDLTVEQGNLGGSFSEAWGINESGEIVGVAEDASSNLHAVLWDGATIKDLALGANSIAYAISDSGAIAGQRQGQAFLRNAFGTTNYIDADHWVSAPEVAYDTNGLRAVGAVWNTANGADRGFSTWNENTTCALIPIGKDLDTLVPDTQSGLREARAINSQSDIGGRDRELPRVWRNDYDGDGDGIAVSIDQDTSTPSTVAEDPDGHEATITDAGTQDLLIVDARDPAVGLIVNARWAAAPGTAATVDFACTQSGSPTPVSASLTAGDAVSMTCGSAILGVISGEVEATFEAEDGTISDVTLVAGSNVRFIPETNEFEAAPTNSAPVEVVVDGTTITIDPGDTQVAEPGLTVDDCPGGYNIIEGTDGDDIIEGTNGNDCILGYGGDDTIDGGKGDDMLIGGSGADFLDGNKGDDELIGESGTDELLGGKGLDRLVGGGDGDVCDGGQAEDIIEGGDGADMLEGGQGDDIIDGGDGDDYCSGGQGSDLISGGAGDDILEGGQGSDDLDGGPGNDTCDGAGCSI